MLGLDALLSARGLNFHWREETRGRVITNLNIFPLLLQRDYHTNQHPETVMSLLQLFIEIIPTDKGGVYA